MGQPELPHTFVYAFRKGGPPFVLFQPQLSPSQLPFPLPGTGGQKHPPPCYRLSLEASFVDTVKWPCCFCCRAKDSALRNAWDMRVSYRCLLLIEKILWTKKRSNQKSRLAFCTRRKRRDSLPQRETGERKGKRAPYPRFTTCAKGKGGDGERESWRRAKRRAAHTSMEKKRRGTTSPPRSQQPSVSLFQSGQPLLRLLPSSREESWREARRERVGVGGEALKDQVFTPVERDRRLVSSPDIEGRPSLLRERGSGGE